MPLSKRERAAWGLPSPGMQRWPTTSCVSGSETGSGSDTDTGTSPVTDTETDTAEPAYRGCPCAPRPPCSCFLRDADPRLSERGRLND